MIVCLVSPGGQWRSRWTDIDPDGIRARIATITTISSPHYGTYLADSGVVCLLRNTFRHLTSIPQASVIALQVAKLAIDRPVIHEALIAGVQGWSDSARLVVSLMTDEKLLEDLRPDAMEKTRQERPPVLQVPVTCFVTTIPTKPVVNEGKVRKADDLIACLERLTGDVRGSLPPAADENLRELNAFRGPVVRNPAAEVPAFEAPTSDGVVNAMTQILRSPGRERVDSSSPITATSSGTMTDRIRSRTERRSTTGFSAAAPASATTSSSRFTGRSQRPSTHAFDASIIGLHDPRREPSP